MKLNLIYLSLDDFGPNKGNYSGHMEFVGQFGRIQLKIGPDISQRVIALVAEQLVEAAKETSKLMVGDILEHDQTLAIPGA